MGQDKRRQSKFFEAYSQNLSIVRKGTEKLVVEPDIDDVFVCPLCFKYFTRDDMEAELLSLEHVPPEKLGGKIRTLTCQKCNKEDGSSLDSHLKKLLEFNELWEGTPNSSQEIKYSFNGSEFVPATLHRQSDGIFVLEGQPHRTNPRHLQEIDQLIMARNPNEVIFNFRFRLYKKRRPEAALLRIAYLYAFSILGYSFLVNPNLAVIRGQLHNPNESILPAWGIASDLGLPDETLGVNLIVEPKELRSFLVVFDLITPRGTKNRWGVLLPGPSRPGGQIFSWLNEQANTPFSQRCIPISQEMNYFVNEPFATYDIWNTW